MLQVTEAAADAIKNMLAEAEMDQGGLRISAELDENQEPGLHLGFEPEPQEGDQTLEQHGATVYLDPAAADALEDKVLDADAHGDHAHFGLLDQEG
jgi:iron-sulfur cluster assembly protein